MRYGPFECLENKPHRDLNITFVVPSGRDQPEVRVAHLRVILSKTSNVEYVQTFHPELQKAAAFVAEGKILHQGKIVIDVAGISDVAER